MLTLILGRAKSGKTAAVMQEIRARVENRQGNTVLLVPEQYSHEAETELLRVCGDSLSLWAEVLSFSRLCARVEDELGRDVGVLMDQGGRLLCMALALQAVGSRLKIFGAARRQAELQGGLLAAIDECKAACVSPETLRAYAEGHSGVLSDKLRDLSLLYEAYEAVMAQGRLDPTDRLTRLSERIGSSSLAQGRFYLDGFTDFTRQEMNVVESLLRAGASVTVCLTCEDFEEGREIFEASRRAAAALRRLAERCGVPCEVSRIDAGDGEGPMAFLERELFSFGTNTFDAGDGVRLCTAGTIGEECEAAAARCLELVRGKNCRWRDIAIAARGFEDYRPALESVFARYGVPLYTAGKRPVEARPLYTLISSAFAIAAGGWEFDDVFTYLKTGLAGLSRAECDALENYAFTWSVRGSAWTREADWAMHPGGFRPKEEYTEETAERLREINALRRRAAAPLAAFAEAGREAATAAEQARVLLALLEDLALPETLQRRARELRAQGQERTAAETAQLWELAMGALEQCAGILGDAPMDQESFGRLYCLVLSQYDIGTIPLSLDRVTAGDFDRMRRRHIRHLIVLGCDGERIPAIRPGGAVLTDDDREQLLAGGIELGDGAEDRLCHEFALIYNCLTLPSESLYLSRCTAGDGETESVPSFVVSRVSALFNTREESVDLDRCRAGALLPARERAASALHGGGGKLGLAALAYFQERDPDGMERLRSAVPARGSLSRRAVRALYGEKLRLSASRVDKLASCRFAYFLQYGLRARPRQAALFAPPEMGSFMHYVLERTAAEIQGMGGFAAVGPETAGALCEKYVGQYIHDVLNDFSEKTARFAYLFRRMTGNVRRVVTDMARELAASDFAPLDFELDFGRAGDIPPIELGGGEDALTLTGIADRVDGYLHEGKLYIRVVDYKTGVKKFSLSDVWYGMGLQMLLYLFALGQGGENRYGQKIVPAGVLYVPARDVLVSAKAELDDEEIIAEKAKQLRRSGLLLDDAEILRAMERGDTPQYLPLRFKDGRYSGEALASAERLGRLSRHIDRALRAMAAELRAGSIAADPYFRSQTDSACALCDYRDACHFDEETDMRRYLTRLPAKEVWDKIETEEGDAP